MIDKREVMEFSREFNLNPNVIEKDYVIGLVLWGISNHLELASNWAFKGGTCLKKCYFETYRFSEDLDFTITNPAHLSEGFLVSVFHDISEWIYESVGIEIPSATIRFEIYENTRGGLSAEGRLGYRGPMQRRGDPARIKLDLTIDEVLVLGPVLRKVHHPYSDGPGEGIHIRCYPFEEVFAEKIRALAERERPRDLYDVVHLYRHDELRPDRAVLLQTLEEKCAFKGISVPTMAALENRPARAELESEWENMLAHQLPVLPPFEQFWQELPEVFEWLHGRGTRVAQPPISSLGQTIDEAWAPPAMAQAWHTETPFEVIRSAGANWLCVDLTYQNSSRLIEPYSLRRTRAGDLLLFAIKHQTGEPRSYRVDRIQGAKATTIPFKPKYAIELTSSAPIAAPPINRRSPDLHISKPRAIPSIPRNPPRRSGSSDPEHVFRCPLCSKLFIRKSYNASLNPHKNKAGYPCAGRIGIFVTTKC